MSEEQKADTTAEEKEAVVDNEDYKERYLRALADYQNLLRQTQKEKEEFFRYALADFLYDLLPTYDNLKLAVSSLSPEEEKNPWVAGVRHVLRQFQEALAAKGVEEIKTVGEKFDPETMEAMSGEGETVEKELKPGYKLNGKVIVAAKVTVK
jgi:molecular chaperone GrpE